MAREEKIVTPTTEDTVDKMTDSTATTTIATATAAATQSKPCAQDFIAVKIIGEGSFSTVFKARLVRDPSRVYACKICSKDKIRREKKVEAVFRERDVMNFLLKHSSPFFIKLCWTFHDTNKLYFVMNYARNGELLNYIKPHGLNLECTTFYAAEILRGLEHLHSLGIVHRDLKPENILLNDRMHIQITDFGSAKIENQALLSSMSSSNSLTTSSASPQASPTRRPQSPDQRLPGVGSKQTNGQTGHHQHSNPWNRRRSFVGTAQYVSPEMLSSKHACKSSDIWALGCIVYQMMSGSFPFKASSDYLIFQKILKLDYKFPESFIPIVRDFVESILKIEPEDRLGVKDFDANIGVYEGIREHGMFRDITGRWDSLHEEIPPLSPLNSSQDDEQEDMEIMEPGFDERTIARLALFEENHRRESMVKTIPDASDTDFKERLEKQRKENVYHQFVEGNLIIHQGLIDKWKGILARRRERMFLLTTGPHLYYVDPKEKVLKGQVPLSAETRPEAKNFKTFYIHTPNRTYNLEDNNGDALVWCRRIEEVKKKYFGRNSVTSSSLTNNSNIVANIHGSSSLRSDSS